MAFGRFKEARAAAKPNPEMDRHINAALNSYHQAFELLPPDAADDLAVTHSQLGMIYNNVGDIDRALPHYRESIRYFEAAGDLYHAATARYYVALALAQSGRLPDAREYALAALRNFETYGDAAAQDIQKTQQLIAKIDQAIAKGASS
ncbi:MAG: tetratricopeptide repeat protein [Phycisphaerae bacterium]